MMSNGLIALIGILTVYVSVVVWIGPWLMRNRKPFSLRRVILLYNLINIVYNFYFFCFLFKVLKYGIDLFDFRRKFNDEDTDWTRRIVANVWFYLMMKLFDLIETVFFVMRKKQSQVSFLHVYHHSAVPIIVWMAVRLAPTSGSTRMFPLLNSAVHVVMYSYYLMAALGPQYQRYLFWKKWITTIQLIQFVVIALHGILLLIRQQGFPGVLNFMPIVQAPLFFVMFYRFFQATY